MTARRMQADPIHGHLTCMALASRARCFRSRIEVPIGRATGQAPHHSTTMPLYSDSMPLQASSRGRNFAASSTRHIAN